MIDFPVTTPPSTDLSARRHGNAAVAGSSIPRSSTSSTCTGGAAVTAQLTLVKVLDGVMIVDQVDYSTNSTVQKLQ